MKVALREAGNAYLKVTIGERKTKMYLVDLSIFKKIKKRMLPAIPLWKNMKPKQHEEHTDEEGVFE
jgi:hypothetical protein